MSISDKNKSRAQYEKTLKKKISQISFEYCRYNDKKMLEIYPLPDGSTERTVNPVKLMWVNGYYYLVTLKVKDSRVSYINYRVDRMVNVRCLDTDALTVPDKFDPEEYKSKNPVMYTMDSKCTVTLRCAKKLINNALDTFGFDIGIKPDESDSDYVFITIRNTSTDGVKMWALEYYFGAEVLKPKALRDEIRGAVKMLAEKYGI